MFEAYRDVVTLEEVQEMLQMGRASIIALTKTGKLPYIKVYKNYRFRKCDIIKMTENEVKNYEKEKENVLD